MKTRRKIGSLVYYVANGEVVKITGYRGDTRTGFEVAYDVEKMCGDPIWHFTENFIYEEDLRDLTPLEQAIYG